MITTVRLPPYQQATMITTVGARRLASASQDNNSSSIQPSRPLSPPEHKTARY
jgi:hypothetical protein